MDDDLDLDPRLQQELVFKLDKLDLEAALQSAKQYDRYALEENTRNLVASIHFDEPFQEGKLLARQKALIHHREERIRPQTAKLLHQHVERSFSPDPKTGVPRPITPGRGIEVTKSSKKQQHSDNIIPFKTIIVQPTKINDDSGISISSSSLPAAEKKSTQNTEQTPPPLRADLLPEMLLKVRQRRAELADQRSRMEAYNNSWQIHEQNVVRALKKTRKAHTDVFKPKLQRLPTNVIVGKAKLQPPKSGTSSSAGKC